MRSVVSIMRDGSTACSCSFIGDCETFMSFVAGGEVSAIQTAVHPSVVGVSYSASVNAPSTDAPHSSRTRT